MTSRGGTGKSLTFFNSVGSRMVYERRREEGKPGEKVKKVRKAKKFDPESVGSAHLNPEHGWIRIQLGLPVPGSESQSESRSRRRIIIHKKGKNEVLANVLKSSIWAVLALGRPSKMSKTKAVYYANCYKFIKVTVLKSIGLDPDPDSAKRLDPEPEIGEFGCATLIIRKQENSPENSLYLAVLYLV